MLRVILPTKASGHGCRSGSAAFEQVIGPQQKLITIVQDRNSYWLSTIINKRHRASHEHPLSMSALGHKRTNLKHSKIQSCPLFRRLHYRQSLPDESDCA